MVPEVAADDAPCGVQVLPSLGGHVDGRLDYVGKRRPSGRQRDASLIPGCVVHDLSVPFQGCLV